MDLQLGIIPKAQVTPWEPKKKKQKGVGSFLAQKSQDVVRKETEAADAVRAQARLQLTLLSALYFANNTATQ